MIDFEKFILECWAKDQQMSLPTIQILYEELKTFVPEPINNEPEPKTNKKKSKK
jgi:hypothetical protein